MKLHTRHYDRSSSSELLRSQHSSRSQWRRESRPGSCRRSCLAQSRDAFAPPAKQAPVVTELLTRGFESSTSKFWRSSFEILDGPRVCETLANELLLCLSH